METSTLSSLDKDYDDGVYDKANPPVKKKKRSRSRSPGDKASKLPALMLVCLSSLFVFSFMGTLVSGLYFNRRVTTVITATDCLGQSWIMFSVCFFLLSWSFQPRRPACFIIIALHSILHPFR